MPPSPITSTSVYRPAMTLPIPSQVATMAPRGAGDADSAAVLALGSDWSDVFVARSGWCNSVAIAVGVGASGSNA